MNFNFNLLRTLYKDSFHAHKTALINHRDICIKTFCDICSYLGQIKSYTWDVKNYARYIMPLHNDQPKAFKTNKTVRFGNSFVKENLSKGFKLNFASLELACMYNVSLKETGLLIVEI